MVKNLLKRVFGKKAAGKNPPPEGQVVRVNLDELGPGAADEFREVINDLGDITFFEGRVEHGYSLDYVSTPEACPRCQAPTRQHYGQWIYATQVAPRVMLAPAGYFCTRCPTVIVDEAMVQMGIKKQFRYQGVLGLDHQQGKDPDLFRTWNGGDTIHIFDENGILQGISTLGSLSLHQATKSSRITKPRQRPAKKAKKRARRKK